EGTHYHIRQARFLPRPVQTPRIPIWVAGFWPRKAPFRRAARWDGVFGLGQNLPLTEMMTPEDMREMLDFVLKQRAQAGLADQPFEVIHGGVSSGANQEADRALALTYAEVGVTWWLEMLVPNRWGSWEEWPLDAMRQRIRQGPPQITEPI